MEGGSALLTELQPNFLAHPRGQPHILSLSSASRESKLKLLCSPPSHKIPPTGKGSLYIRPLLMGTGAVLGLAPAPEYTFLIYVSPVGNYFKEGVAPISLVVEHELHRATPGGTGGVKTIGNYAAVLKAQSAAKAKGYSDVLYLDCVHKKYLEEVSSCNIFVVKGNVISTPAVKGTILPYSQGHAIRMDIGKPWIS
ncbi:hypothetical protein SAY86_029964 [Trapa natans]|uniref:Branched-chain-amino-acid aminotransferase n=1 Tax=Trapa natans TaxID=22666 RepID=A0AAN7LX90_TRANT|nr:hypothetical protein SAY86_029964 [Trapa natans]